MEKNIEKNRSNEKLSILVVVALFLIPFIFLIVQKAMKHPLGFIVGLFIIIFLFTLPILFLEFSYRWCLKSESAEKLIKFYLYWATRKHFNEDDDIFMYPKSLIYALYGEYENAQTCLDKVNCERQPRSFQANKYCIEALFQFLKPGDYSNGMVLAEKALALYDGGINLFNTDRRRYTIYVNIGNILTNERIDTKILTELENLFKKSFVFHKLLIAWALSNGYKKASMNEKAMKYEMYCNKVAPHCTPLHQPSKCNLCHRNCK